MNDGEAEKPKNDIKLEYEFNEPPQKVWRAISIPEFREHWLPTGSLADPKATSTTPGEKVSYRMREQTPPFLESTVTFKIAPNATGGTCLTIIHEMNDVKIDRVSRTPVNNNVPSIMLAA